MQPTASRADVGAFRALYEDHYGFVYATVQRMGVRVDAIDDVVHDAFLVVFRRWDDLPADRERAWLYGIARRVSSNARKGDRRRARKHDALRSVHAESEDVRGWLEASTALRRFIASLRPEDRELFVLGAIEGLTGKELAAALSAPASTLYGRLQGLRRQFRDVAGGEAMVAVERARTKRPRASAAGWAVLLPSLGLSSASTGAFAWGVGAAAIVAVAGTIAWVPADAAVSASRLEPDVSPVIPQTFERPSVPAVASVEARATIVPASAAPIVARPARVRRTQRPDPLAAEATLVQSIRAESRAGKSHEALRLVAEHRRTHAQGVLSDVVVALEVEALCDLGRTDDARVRADALLRQRPNTPVARRLSFGCISKKNDRGSENPDARGHGGE